MGIDQPGATVHQLEVRPERSDAPTWGTDDVLTWETDPGTPSLRRPPVLRPRPKLERAPLPVAIVEQAPAHSGQPGTPEFRYWNLAESLRRAADFWGPLMPPSTTWHRQVGRSLRAILDGGDDLNAYYDRQGLRFYHHTINGITVYSGESPDVICHETGHAVLDAIRPQLWNVQSAEVAAFHESFGDISSLLSNLLLPSLRKAVIVETGGDLSRSSQLSRLAEQLGWALRLRSPGSVDADCMRNASNKFFYQDPMFLPTSAPASVISRSPHSFSRIFTGAYLRALGGIYGDQDSSGPDALLKAAQEAGRLLVGGVRSAPIVPAYFASVAAHVILRDRESNGGRYGDSLRRAFLRHGILSPQDVGILSEAVDGERGITSGEGAEAGQEAAGPVMHTEDGQTFGLDRPLSFELPAPAFRFGVAGEAAEERSSNAARWSGIAFVEDLFRRDRVATPADSEVAANRSRRRYTHEIVEGEADLLLVRRLFE